MSNEQNNTQDLGQILNALEQNLNSAILTNHLSCQPNSLHLTSINELVSSILSNCSCEPQEALLEDCLKKHFPRLYRIAIYQGREIDPKYNVIKIISHARAHRNDKEFLHRLFSYVFVLYTMHNQ